MEKNKKQFVKGLFVNRNDKAPDYVVCNLGVKIDEFILWLRNNQGGEFLNIDIKLSKEGKYYAELNTYNKADALAKKQQDEVEENQSQLNNLDLNDENQDVEYPDDEIKADDIF